MTTFAAEMHFLKLNNLAIGYGDSIIQEQLTLSARGGEMICLLGQNGCGKSTLLRTLAGLQPPLSGELSYASEAIGNSQAGAVDLSAIGEKERAKYLSIVLTERISVDRTTVHDVVAMGRYPYASWIGGLTDEDEQIISHAIDSVEMSHKATTFFNNLSDGEKQRALIAKAIAQQTPLILLDEPTAHLDLPNRIKTLLLLRQLAHESGKMVLISTHELDLALQTADRIWLMKPHAGVAVGSPEELIQSGEFQRAFADEHFSFVGEGKNLRIELK